MRTHDLTAAAAFITKKAYCLLLLLSILDIMASTAWCAESTFVKMEYGGFLSVEVPQHWTFMDENSKKNMNNFSEAVAKLNNINLDQGNNNILISANSYNQLSNFPIATLRVSVKLGKTLTQDDIQKIAKYSAVDLREFFAPIVAETEHVMLSTVGCKSYKIVDNRIAKNSSVSCLYSESQSDLGNGMMIN